MIEIILTGLPEGPNVTKTWHWAKKAKKVKQWRVMAAWMASKHRPKTPFSKIELSIIRFSSQPMDADNAIASCKPLIDGLKDAKIIVDDNPNVIVKIHYEWQKASPKQGQIKLIVEEVE